ncbi:alpha/beta fold hydrolase [Streptomyces sp. NPDC057445]|uniref:alpha/beta fold hydrolase n=1 Tax=Streptomyces sp. NPDC057445 TaxID=3346136 RepID=UPI0036A94972
MSGSAETGKVGGFLTDEGRERFLAAYDRAMRCWPEPRAGREIGTRFGATYVHVYNEEAGGIPLVLLHGANSTSAAWSRCIAAFGADRPVYAVDTVGDAGRSVQTAPLRGPEDLSEWLDEVLDEVLDGRAQTRVHLVGMSYGGWIALVHATRTARRLASVTALDPPRALAPLKPSFLLGAIAAAVSGSDRRRRRFLGTLMGPEGSEGSEGSETTGGGTNEGQESEAYEGQMDLMLAAMRHFRPGTPHPQKIDDEPLRSLSVPVLVLLAELSAVHAARRAQTRATALLPAATAWTETVPGARHVLPADVLSDLLPRFHAEVDAADGP